MTVIAWEIFLVLQVIAGIHTLWAMGIYWPAKSENQLAATVIGVGGAGRLPPNWMTLIAAAFFSSAGFCALWAAGLFGFPGLSSYVAAGLGILFVGRGLMTYQRFGPLQSACQPFRTLDLFLFAPAILGLGVGFLALSAV